MVDEELKSKELSRQTDDLLNKIKLSKMLIESRNVIKQYTSSPDGERDQLLQDNVYQVKLTRALITLSIIKYNDRQLAYDALVGTYPSGDSSSYLNKDDIDKLFNEVYDEMNLLKS